MAWWWAKAEDNGRLLKLREAGSEARLKANALVLRKLQLPSARRRLRAAQYVRILTDHQRSTSKQNCADVDSRREPAAVAPARSIGTSRSCAAAADIKREFAAARFTIHLQPIDLNGWLNTDFYT